MSVDRSEMELAVCAHRSAATEGVPAAAAKATDPVAIILVEGPSDQIAVETVAARRGRDLVAERVSVVPIGGAGAIRRVLAAQASGSVRLAALCDAGEEALVHRGVDSSGLDVAVFVCVADLEAELIRAVGVDRALEVLDREGDRGPFETLQKQVAWRGQPVAAQLRRFIGAGARRKLRYARLLGDAAIDIDRAPRPLIDVLDAVRGVPLAAPAVPSDDWSPSEPRTVKSSVSNLSTAESSHPFQAST